MMRKVFLIQTTENPLHVVLRKDDNGVTKVVAISNPAS